MIPTPEEKPEAWKTIRMEHVKQGDIVAYEDERLVDGRYEVVGWNLLRITRIDNVRGWFKPHFENVKTGDQYVSFEDIEPQKTQTVYQG